jgi:hypothetical protein
MVRPLGGCAGSYVSVLAIGHPVRVVERTTRGRPRHRRLRDRQDAYTDGHHPDGYRVELIDWPTLEQITG